MEDQNVNRLLKHTYVPAFDGLRGLVLTVMFVHLEIFCPVFEGHVKTKFLLFSQAWYTLNIFFCLSGFLITWLLVNEMQTTGQLNLLRFYKRRTVRLLPAYLTALIVSCWLASLWGSAPKQIFHDGDLFLTYTYNIAVSYRTGAYLLQPGIFSVAGMVVVRGRAILFCVVGRTQMAENEVCVEGHDRDVDSAGILSLWAAVLHAARGIFSGSDRDRFYFGTDTRINAILWVARLLWRCRTDGITTLPGNI